MPKQFTFLILLFVLIAGGSIAFGFSTGTNRLKEVSLKWEEEKQVLISRIDALEKTIDSLQENTEATRLAFLEESQREAQRKMQEDQTKEELESRFTQLQNTLSAQETKLTGIESSSDITPRIQEWSTFVYDLSCTFTLSDGRTAKGGGSAVLERTAQGIRFMTNRHVLEADNARLESCRLTQPGSDILYEIDEDDITLGGGDVGYGLIPEAVFGMLPWQKCTTVPAIGDSVVMLGYPSIGARASVTATEGIISGFDDDYYTTSAKIDKGNSGGAAIDIKRNCFIGIPTLVFAGKVESLARILPVFRIGE